MPGSLRVEVLNFTTIASIETLRDQKSLFTHIAAFYKAVNAPDGPGAGQSLDAWLGPLVDFARSGGSIELTDPRPLHRFYLALVKYLASADAKLSPLPISHLVVRVETSSPADTMPKEISGTSDFFASLFQKRLEVITGNFGKTKRIVKTAGHPIQRAEVSAWVYSKSIPSLAVGQVWETAAR